MRVENRMSGRGWSWMLGGNPVGIVVNGSDNVAGVLLY